MLRLPSSATTPLNAPNLVSTTHATESPAARATELQTIANRYNAYAPAFETIQLGALAERVTANDNRQSGKQAVVPSDLNLIFAKTQQPGEVKPSAGPSCAVAAPKQMFSIAVEQGCYLLEAGKPVEAVMQTLGITPGTSAERILFAHVGRKPPQPAPSLLTGPAQSRNAEPAPPSPLPDVVPFPVHIVPREPHPYRSSGAEAWLTAACGKVARGADYQQVFADSGYTVPDSGFEGECSEFKALHDQAIGSARNALLAGKSYPATVAWFHIKNKFDLFSLAMYAAEEVGAPRVRLGESFVDVKKELGIGAYGEAVQVLVEAMPDH